MRKTPWKPFWKIFPALAALPVAALAVYTNAVISDRLDELLRDERFVVDLGIEAVGRGLNRVAADICALVRQNELAAYLASGDTHWRTAMGDEYLALAENSGVYDQIRFLDDTGMEVVRVNFGDGEPYITADEDLQDKASRYYFTESLALQPGEIYVSPLDLNIEHGEIEIPYKPMIRVGTPISDEDGRIRGIVLINFLAQAMLDRVADLDAISIGHPIMFNDHGYWLVGPNPPPSWGFMFPEHTESRMSVLYPGAWDQMTGNSQGDFLNENGLFAYRDYHPLQEIGNCVVIGGDTEQRDHTQDYRWILASHVTHDDLNALERQAIRGSLAIGGPLLLFLAIGTRAVNISIVQRQRHQARLETLARFDPLTELANRTTLEERLSREHSRAQRSGRRFAVLYLDLDGFKAINDCHGHEAGDKVLVEVARILDSCCRSVDTPARIGGDEFVVLLSEVVDADAVRRVAERIAKRIAALTREDRIVGASIGVVVWPDHTDDTSQIIRLADQAMYAAKTAGKNGISFAESP